MKLIQERTAFKLLLEQNGLLVSFTTKRRAFFVFVTGVYVGLRVAPTTDPELGVVELSGYDIRSILRDWNRLSRVRLPKPVT